MDRTKRCRRCVVTVLFALAAFSLATISPAAAGAPQKAPADDPSKADPSKADPSEADPSKAMCPGLSKSIHQHLAAIATLTKEIERTEKGGAGSLLGLFKQLAGEPYTNPVIAQKRQAIERKTRLVKDMNGVLVSLGCQSVELPPALNKMAAPGK